ncbi:MAG: 30S ribosomal protein S13 [Veillonella sp.]|nr:30S ribosomal protein S13 [Veillonella sp.]
MARIAGVDLPRDKRVEIGLTYIYGIGPTLASEIIAKTGINPDTRVRDLSEDEVAKIRELLKSTPIEANVIVWVYHFVVNVLKRMHVLAKVLEKQLLVKRNKIKEG